MQTSAPATICLQLFAPSEELANFNFRYQHNIDQARRRQDFKTSSNNGLSSHRQRTLYVWRLVWQVLRSEGESLIGSVCTRTEASSSLPLPAVLTAPIRLDVVQQVHSE